MKEIENKQTVSKEEIRALLATAVEEGLMESGIMKNISRTKYWYFSDKVKYNKDEDKP